MDRVEVVVDNKNLVLKTHEVLVKASDANPFLDDIYEQDDGERHDQVKRRDAKHRHS